MRLKIGQRMINTDQITFTERGERGFLVYFAGSEDCSLKFNPGPEADRLEAFLAAEATDVMELPPGDE